MDQHDQLNAKNLVRRKVLGTLGSLTTISVLPRFAHASEAKVLAVRTWPADDYSRVTIELNAPLKADHFLLENPNRLVVDLQGLTLNQALNSLVSKIKPSDPYISKLRVGQNRGDVVRLVIDLKQKVNPQVFTLKPIGNYQYRLVLDLYPTNPKDPLLAHLDSQVNDPLAGIIDDLSRKQGGSKKNPSVAQAPSRSSSSSSSSFSRRRGNRDVIIALDPGHGGEDPGATGPRGTHEKDVVLSIGKKLYAIINNQPGMSAYMTRNSDFFVPLGMRVTKARRAKADLFVSIHADASPNRQAHGTSVFALSRSGASSATARWLANKENAADMIGGVDFNTQDRKTASVLLDMSTNAQIQEALKMGHSVLGSLSKVNGIQSRRVEQAGFAVLKSPDIPSILVETAFISNAREEAFLRNTSNHYAIAQGILNGIKNYLATNPPLSRAG